MARSSRIHYYRRVLAAYLLPTRSQLTFWHDQPACGHFDPGVLGEYYMLFSEKADYPGPFDTAGIPLLDYRGNIGRQYNPIAIAQYGLGNHSLYVRTGHAERRQKFLAAAGWLVCNLEKNPKGLWVWNHQFDFEYRTTLRAPWYSGLAQGQGISVLLRAHTETGDDQYLDGARRAFAALLAPVDEGGVAFIDADGRTWIEEYIVSPPTHILNGFIWASWGVYDYWLATRDRAAERLFQQAMATLAAVLPRYDTGFWSLYEQSGTRLKMLASPFYHRLHTVQLRILHALSADERFALYAQRWEDYQRKPLNRARAVMQKAVFKLCYY